MIESQTDIFDGEAIFADRWIVRLQIQGEYTHAQLVEFAGFFRLAIDAHINKDAIIRMAIGEKRIPDAIIQVGESRKALRFVVYNIDERIRAETVMKRLNRTCDFFSIKHKSLKLQCKPAPKIITPDVIKVFPRKASCLT